MYSGIKWGNYLAVWGLCLMLAGCAGGHWGRLTHSKTRMDQYVGKHLPENFNYYYCHKLLRPYAVIGIDPFYTLETRGWFRIESRNELYRKIQTLSKIEDVHSFLNTKNIIHPAGGIIGAWFSYYESTSVHVDENTRRVKVATPYPVVPRIHLRGVRSLFRDD